MALAKPDVEYDTDVDGTWDPAKVWMNGKPLEPSTGYHYEFYYEATNGTSGKVGEIWPGGIYFDHYHQVSFILQDGIGYRFYYVVVHASYPPQQSDYTRYYYINGQITDLKRIGDHNSDTFVLSWKNNYHEGSTIFTSIQIYVYINDVYYERIVVMGNIETYSYESPTKAEKLNFNVFPIYGVSAGGPEQWLYNQYGKPAYPTDGIITNDKSKVTVSFTADLGRFAGRGFNVAVQGRFASSDDGTTWSSWKDIEHIGWIFQDSLFSAYQRAEKAEYIKICTRYFISGLPDGGTRTSDWSQEYSFHVSFQPKKPVVKYDKELKVASIELDDDDLGNSPNGRLVWFVLNGENEKSWNGVSSSQQTIDVGKVLPASSFVIMATVKTDFWEDAIPSEPLPVDYDLFPAFVEDNRYGAFIVYDDGTVVPAAILPAS